MSWLPAIFYNLRFQFFYFFYASLSSFTLLNSAYFHALLILPNINITPTHITPNPYPKYIK